MINSKYFFQGFSCIKKMDSPAIALGCCFIAIGALLKNLGFSIQESIFSTLLTYALPGSLVMAESLLVGASLVNIFLAVWLVNARLYPMTVFSNAFANARKSAKVEVLFIMSFHCSFSMVNHEKQLPNS